jgi:hypothetical protein
MKSISSFAELTAHLQSVNNRKRLAWPMLVTRTHSMRY